MVWGRHVTNLLHVQEAVHCFAPHTFAHQVCWDGIAITSDDAHNIMKGDDHNIIMKSDFH